MKKTPVETGVLFTPYEKYTRHKDTINRELIKNNFVKKNLT